MFSLMNDMIRKKKEGECGDRKLKEKTEEAACSETEVKFSTDSLCPEFVHLSMHLSLRVTYKNHFLCTRMCSQKNARA